MSRPLRVEYPGAVYHVTSRVWHLGTVVDFVTLREAIDTVMEKTRAVRAGFLFR